ncbi:MAG: SPOR domain-containing protein [Burkholderiales bacterium]
MRTVLVLLLLANLTLFAYTRLDSAAGGEGVRLAQQVQPEKIRLLTPQQVAALGPAKAAALADVCVEWGPFGDAERARAIAELESLGVGRLVATRRVEVTGAWSALVAVYADRGGAERRASSLRQQNLREVSVYDTGRGQFAVAVGGYRTEDAARAQAQELERYGVKNATAAQRPGTVSFTSVVLRDPPSSAVSRVRELQAAFPAAEVKVGTCASS